MSKLIIERIYYRYNEGYRAAVHGEPLNDQVIGQAITGYQAACEDIKQWRLSGEPLPHYIDPEKTGTP